MNRIGHRTDQRGITMIGFLMVLMVAGFFAYLAMRLFPPYSEYMNVSRALESLKTEPGVASKSPNEIRGLLSRRFDVNYVDSINARDVRVTRSVDGVNVQVRYEVRKPFISNIELLITFDKTVVLRRGGNID